MLEKLLRRLQWPTPHCSCGPGFFWIAEIASLPTIATRIRRSQRRARPSRLSKLCDCRLWFQRPHHFEGAYSASPDEPESGFFRSLRRATARTLSRLEVMQEPAPAYESYLPQPAMNLACRREEASGAGFQWATSRDYQAEIYWLLGAHNRGQRSEYAQEAFEINGCYKAQRWIGKPKP